MFLLKRMQYCLGCRTCLEGVCTARLLLLGDVGVMYLP